MVLDDELDGRVLADRIEWLLSDDQRLRSMGERARAWSSRTPRRARADGPRGGDGDERRTRPPPGSIPTLDVPNLADVRRVHMIGIGGAGMRNLARLSSAGCRRDGFGPEGLEGVQELRALGATIATGHAGANLGDADTVVVSSAIRDDNPELVEARRRGIPTWARAQALAAAATDRREIAVAGTHGKTTTTAMIALVLERAGLDPTYVIGGDMNESGSGRTRGRGSVRHRGGRERRLSSSASGAASSPTSKPITSTTTAVRLEEIDNAFNAFAGRWAHASFAPTTRPRCEPSRARSPGTKRPRDRTRGPRGCRPAAGRIRELHAGEAPRSPVGRGRRKTP